MGRHGIATFACGVAIGFLLALPFAKLLETSRVGELEADLADLRYRHEQLLAERARFSAKLDDLERRVLHRQLGNDAAWEMLQAMHAGDPVRLDLARQRLEEFRESDPAGPTPGRR